MKITKPKTLASFIVAIALISLSVWFSNGPNFFSFFGSTADVTLTGSTPDTVSESTLVKHADAEANMEIVIGLAGRNTADLDALLERQSDPQSSDYLNYLSVDEFVARYSPTQSDVDSVVKYLALNGIKVKLIPANRLLIHAEGNVAQLERAFHVQINEYQYLAGTASTPVSTTYLSNDRDPSVPAHLKNIVVSVIGLNTLDSFQSRIARPMGPPAHPRQSALTPKDVAEGYNLPNSNNKNSTRRLNGSGVTMAIVTAEGYDPKDVESYWQRTNVNRTGKVIDVPINGTTKAINEETTMDLELMGAQLPAADIHMYIASDARFVNFALAFNQMVTDNKADVMSVSWGLCERGTGWLMIKTENMIFKQAASQGIALFASSGDDGVYDCKQKKLRWEVDFPSSSPYVTAVGGTTFVIDKGARVSESAWEGSGGGISNHFDRPTWQTGRGIPDEDKRQSADVSMAADPYTGYLVTYKGGLMKIGGTSASAPTMAALWGMNVIATGRRLGPANPHFYRIGRSPDYNKVFFDVVKGQNGAGRGPGYKAKAGWDNATGWGAPDGEELVKYMTRTTPKKTK